MNTATTEARVFDVTLPPGTGLSIEDAIAKLEAAGIRLGDTGDARTLGAMLVDGAIAVEEMVQGFGDEATARFDDLGRVTLLALRKDAGAKPSDLPRGLVLSSTEEPLVLPFAQVDGTCLILIRR